DERVILRAAVNSINNNMRQAVSYPFLNVVIIIIVWLNSANNVEGNILQQCRREHIFSDHSFQRIYKPGDITLTGLFPIHAELIAYNTTGEEERVNFFNFHGFNWALAMAYTAEWVNNQTDFLPNITLGYDIRDTFYNIEHAVNQAINLTRSIVVQSTCSRHGNECHSKQSPASQFNQQQQQVSPLVSIGPSYAWIASPVADIFSTYGIPLISYESAIANDQNSNQLFLQVRHSNFLQASVIANLIEKFQWSYITVISSDDEFGRVGLQSLQEELKSRDNICIGRNFVIPGGDQIDFTQIKRMITTIKNDINIQVCVVYTNVFQGYAVFEEATRQKLTQTTWITPGELGQSPGILHQNKDVLQGMLTVTLPDKNPPMDFELFLASNENSLGLNTSVLPNSWQHEYLSKVQQCRSERFTMNANQNCNLKCSYRKFFCYGINNIEGFDYVINAVLAVATAIEAMKDCRPGYGLLNGKRCPKPPPNINPRDLWTYLRAVEFKDLFGYNFSFNHHPDSHFLIKNLQLDAQGKPKLVPVGEWLANDQNATLQMNYSKIIWRNNAHKIPVSRCNKPCPPGYQIFYKTSQCCWNCIPCKENHYSEKEDSISCSLCKQGYRINLNSTGCNKLPVTYISLSDGNTIAIIFTFCSLLGCLVTLAFISLFIRYRNNGTIKASSIELSILLLVFIMISFSLPILFCLKPTDALCRVRSFLSFNTFTPLLALLLAKTHRIVRLFHARLSTLMDRKCLSNAYILLQGAIISAVPLALSIITLALYPSKAAYVYDDYLVVSLECQGSKSPVAAIFQYIMYAYFGILALYCAYLAYRQRRLPARFNEARQIAFPMCAICLTSVATIITDFSTSGEAKVIVYSMVIIVNCAVILVFLFVPKIHSLRQNINKDNVHGNGLGSRLRDIMSLGFTIGFISTKNRSSTNDDINIANIIAPEGETFTTDVIRESEIGPASLENES
ncbi:Metabotropic glutamate receptor 7, partial [Trichoplax sp. H2]